MEGIVYIFGDILNRTNSLIAPANWGYTLLLFAVLIKFLLGISTFREARNLQMVPLLRPEYDKIYNKYKNNPTKRTEEIFIMEKEHGYMVFSGVTFTIIQALVIAIMTFVFLNAQTYLVDLPNIAEPFRFFWIEDLRLSPIQMVTQGEASAITNLIYAMNMPFISVAIYHLLSKYISSISLVEKRIQQKAILASMVVILFITPQAVALYLAASMILNALQFAVILKFVPLKRLKGRRRPWGEMPSFLNRSKKTKDKKKK